jgi:hypothetical protein
MSSDSSHFSYNHLFESYFLVFMLHTLYLSLIHGGLTALMHVLQFRQVFDTLICTLMTSGGIICSRFAYRIQVKHITPISFYKCLQFYTDDKSMLPLQ